MQKKYYRAVYEKNTDILIGLAGNANKKKKEGEGKTKVISLMNVGMQLRKCCNHPFLLEGVEQVIRRCICIYMCVYTHMRTLSASPGGCGTGERYR